ISKRMVSQEERRKGADMTKQNPTIVASYEEIVQTDEYDWRNVLLTKVCDDTTTIREIIEWAGDNLDREYFEIKLTRGK
ncbi:MAG: hypothetical protein ACFNYQ_12585, partial [Treponema sp.]|uniref:hypothetical protein n=1 Tax=Treponema sp. TaxID=166 RepID=UPI00360F648A